MDIMTNNESSNTKTKMLLEDDPTPNWVTAMNEVSCTDEEAETTELPAPISWRSQLTLNSKIDCLVTENEWLSAVIINVDKEHFLVRYDKLPPEWDQWIHRDSSRIQARGSHVPDPAQISAQLSAQLLKEQEDWRNGLTIDSRLVCVGPLNKWCTATVILVDEQTNRLYVHYDGWSATCDQWIYRHDQVNPPKQCGAFPVSRRPPYEMRTGACTAVMLLVFFILLTTVSVEVSIMFGMLGLLCSGLTLITYLQSEASDKNDHSENVAKCACCCLLIFFFLLTICLVRKPKDDEFNDEQLALGVQLDQFPEERWTVCYFSEIMEQRDCADGGVQVKYQVYARDKCGVQQLSWWSEDCMSSTRALNEEFACYIDDCESGQIHLNHGHAADRRVSGITFLYVSIGFGIVGILCFLKCCLDYCKYMFQ